MVVLRGPNRAFELANAAFYKLVGHRDILGKSLVETVPEVKEQGFIELLDRVLATGEPFVGTGVPVLLQREPGRPFEERCVDFVYQPIVAADGGVAGLFVEGNDVTDHKHAEDALCMADRRKDEFLATLAHELRSPLAPIRHVARISRTPRATEAHLKWSHEVIDRQVGHMARLLVDLLEVSRITRGKLELLKERLALKESLVEAVETVRPLIEARRHKLTIDVPAVTIHIDVDPLLVWENIAGAQVRFTGQEGRRMHIASETRRYSNWPRPCAGHLTCISIMLPSPTGSSSGSM